MTIVSMQAADELQLLIQKTTADPTDHTSLLALGRLYIKKRDVANAQKTFALADGIKPPSEQERFERARWAVEDDAIDLALSILSAPPPGHADWYRLWSELLHKKRLNEESADVARKGIASFDTPDLHYALARALFALDQHADAMVECECVCKVVPVHGRALRLWGEILRKLGDHETAIDKYEQAEKDPAFISEQKPPYTASYYNGWGNALFRMKRYPEALEKFQRAWSYDDSVAVYKNNIAAAYFVREEWYEAVDAYETALELAPTYSLALSGLAMAQWRMGLTNEGASTFDRAKKASSGLAAGCSYAWSLWRVGRYREARREAAELRDRYRLHRHELLKQEDSDDFAHSAQVFATMLDDLSAAEDALRDAAAKTTLAADSGELHLIGATILLARSQRETRPSRELRERGLSESRAAAYALLQRFKEHPRVVRTEAELQLAGRAFLLMDDLQRAEEYLSEAMKSPSPTTDTLIAQASLSLKKKDTAGATRSLERALSKDPADVAVRALLAEALLAGGDFDRSESELRRVLEQAPGTIEARLLLAKVILEQAEKDSDRYQEALGVLEETRLMAAMADASTTHTPAIESLIRYLRGFVQTRIYNAKTIKSESLLIGAREEFRRCLAIDSENYQARIAIQKIEDRLRPRGSGWISERAAGAICGVVALMILASTMFAIGGGYMSEGYAVLFIFGALSFLIASFYLPQLSKLTIGTLSIEKAAMDDLAKLPLQIKMLPSSSGSKV